jgi:hypothetical protein
MPDPKGTESKMLRHKPEDWPRLFVQYLNSGDLEALVALYAPNAPIRGEIRGNHRRPRPDS